MDDAALIRLAAELAERAAAIILAVRERGFEVIAKSDRSPVTEADHAAEALIVGGLRSETPDLPVIAEEEVARGLHTEPAAAYWLVDPLDGTREFAAGRDDFTVNIGLVRDGMAALGVVGVPAYGEMFAGIPGRGAWKWTRGGEQQPVRVRPVPPEGITVLASRHHGGDPRLQTFLRGYKVATVRHTGSAVKFCRLAEGAGDLYPRFGRTMEWDTAAPQAVLEAAGGAVRLFGGGRLTYGKPEWENPPFLCTGGPA
ncbi:MAG: 3'(2'),5'-bisphosphate nucleotidase CysQ [Acetobacteraceae bacterium]|nr:3'(2'),5'-bisphosphate nucleotidase CysQ [Acetobacteraceae bacterium]